MPKAWRIAVLLGAVLVAAFGVFQALSWRQSKLDRLTEGPLPPIAVAANGGAGGLLLYGDSRIAEWEPVPVRVFPVVRAGYPGETAIRLAPHLASMLDHVQPGAVFVQMGINDAVAASLLPEARRAATLAASIRAFEAMAILAKQRDVALSISLVVPPIRPELSRRIVYREAVDRYVAALNAAIPPIAAAHGVEVVDPVDVLRGGDGMVPDEFRRDALHFTPAAYRALDRLVPVMIAPVEVTPGQAEIPA